MKTSKYFFLGLLSFGLVFTGCNDDDDDEDNTPGTCATPTDLLVDDTEATSVTLSWTSTGTAWTIEYGDAGFAQGSGTEVTADSNPFTVTGLDGDADYDFYVRNNCADNNSGFAGPLSASTPNPIVGVWKSFDVSPLLAGFGIDSIQATFESGQTYDVSSFAGGAQSSFTGTYTTSNDPVNGIYAITLNQTTPSNATSAGIFEVYVASPDSMWYEVVQIDPALGTAPTPEAGFGSSSGGALGTTNIQKYSRVD